MAVQGQQFTVTLGGGGEGWGLGVRVWGRGRVGV